MERQPTKPLPVAAPKRSTATQPTSPYEPDSEALVINISQQERHALERAAHTQHRDTTRETLTKAWAKTLAEPTKPKTCRRGIVGWTKPPRAAPIKTHQPKPTQLHAIREKVPAEHHRSNETPMRTPLRPSELIRYGVAPLSPIRDIEDHRFEGVKINWTRRFQRTKNSLGETIRINICRGIAHLYHVPTRTEEQQKPLH